MSPIELELALIPAGTFLMGSPEGETGLYDDEGPRHDVSVGAFLIGKYQVTNDEYARYLTANPSAGEPSEWFNRRFNQSRQPVVGVSWDDARAFAEWSGCRLPTEVEWEYAARAGTTEPFLDGESEKDLDLVGWFSGNSGGVSHAVGGKAANAWGLYDVLGNVWEWVEDDWHDNYNGAPVDARAWVEQQRAASRVYRGGSWLASARICRVAIRNWGLPVVRASLQGFRVARSLSSADGG